MKVIIVPNNQTMAARHYCIAKALVAAGHEVHYMMWALPYNVSAKELVKHLFTSLIPKRYKHEEFTMHKVSRLPYFWPVINGLLFKFQVKHLFRKLDADIIFSEGYTNELEIPKSLPYIYDLADDYAAPADVYGSKIYKLAFKMLGIRNVMKRQSQNAVAVTGVSEILCDFAKQYNSNVIKLPNGVDTDVIKEVLKDKMTRNTNPHSMVYVTRFGNWSRAIETLQAAVALHDEFPDLTLTLVGDGSESEAMLQFIKDHNVDSYIHYKGFVYDRREMFRHINNAAIGLNISDKNIWRDAAHPIKVIEYSAFGKKVVSTNLVEVGVLGYPNIITFTDTGKGPRMLDAMRTALTDPRTAADFKDVSSKVLREYNWNDIAQQVVDIAKNRLRVVHVTPSYPPSLGGMEKVVQIVAGIQHDMGKQVTVLTSDKDAPAAEPDQFAVTRFKTFVFANTRIMPGMIGALLRLSRRDVVHMHFASAYAPELVWLISKFRGYRYVAHMHLDFVPTGAFGFLVDIYKKYVLKYVLRSATAVIVFTEEQRQQMIARYALNPSRVTAIPNGVQEKFYLDTPRDIHQKPSLLFVGRLELQKNLTQLLEALDGVSDKFETTIVGEGSLRADLEQIVHERTLQNVTFAGRADGAKLLNYYKNADIFVLSSELEGMPLVLLEAMAMALPIVATDVTGTRDVVRDNVNGFLVPLNDGQAFQAALLKIASDKKLYTRLSQNARKQADDYSWNKVVTKLEEAYEISK